MMLESLLKKDTLDRDLRANALESLATMQWYYSLRDASGTSTADQLYNECRALRSTEPQDILGHARVLIWLGILHQRTEGKGEPFFRDALQACQGLGRESQLIVARAERELSITLRMRGQFDKALDLIESSVKAFSALDLLSELAHSVLNRGMLLVFIGHFTKAEENFQQARKHFEKLGQQRPYELAWPLHGLGNVALREGKYPQAREFFEQAAEEWHSDRFGMAVIEGALAEVAYAEGAYDDALKHVERGLPLMQEVNDIFGLGWTYCTQGKAFAEIEHYDDALRAFNEGLKKMGSYQSDYGRCLILLEICSLYAKTGDMAMFKEIGTDVEKNAREFSFHEILARLYGMRGLFRLRTLGRIAGQEMQCGALDEVLSDLSSALIEAVRFNRWRLDALLKEIEVAFIASDTNVAKIDNNSRKTLATGLLHFWRDGNFDGVAFPTIEKAIIVRDGSDRHRETVEQFLKRLVALS